VLDLLLPQRCLICSSLGAQVCACCRSALRYIGPPLCDRCGAPTVWPVRRCAECTGRRLAFVSAIVLGTVLLTRWVPRHPRWRPFVIAVNLAITVRYLWWRGALEWE